MLLTSRGKSSHLKNKKFNPNQDLNLIRSDGTKRKFFFRNGQLRRNLNKRQEKIVNKALKLRAELGTPPSLEH